MDAANQDQELPTDDEHTNLEAQRSIIRQALTEIAGDVGIGMAKKTRPAIDRGLTHTSACPDPFIRIPQPSNFGTPRCS